MLVGLVPLQRVHEVCVRTSVSVLNGEKTDAVDIVARGDCVFDHARAEALSTAVVDGGGPRAIKTVTVRDWSGHTSVSSVESFDLPISAVRMWRSAMPESSLATR